MKFTANLAVCFTCCLGLTVGQALCEPAIIAQSVIAVPTAKTIPVSIFLNREIKGVYSQDCSTFLRLKPLTTGSPEIPYTYRTCVDFLSYPPEPLDGPSLLYTQDLFGATDNPVPDGSIYEIILQFEPGRGLRDKDSRIIPVKTVNGYLVFRQKPLVIGDLDDNGKVEVTDAIMSLRVALGLDPLPDSQPSNELPEPSPYFRAAGDVSFDGELTVADTIKILRLVSGLD